MAERSEVEPKPWLTAERLGAFTDGVVAIIITILVLGIEVPEEHDFTRDGVLEFLMRIEHDVLVYLLSFFLILTYWMLHYILFHYVARTDRTLVFWNGAFLFLLSLSPFTTGLAGAYRGVPVADAIFGLNYLLSGLTFFGMWRYCSAHQELLSRRVGLELRHAVDRQLLVAPILSVLGIAVAVFNFHLAALVYLSIPAFYLKHHLIDGRWREPDDGSADSAAA